jgi:hypothetical protein
MADVFISYSKKDHQQAGWLAKILEARGLRVWWDTKLEAGLVWDEALEEKLEASSLILVLWSKNSVASQWVREEARYGRSKNKLVPAFIDAVEPPLGFGQIQSANLVGWSAEPAHAGLVRLLETIFKRLESTPNKETAASGNEASAQAPSGFSIPYEEDGRGFAKISNLGWGQSLIWAGRQIEVIELDVMIIEQPPSNAFHIKFSLLRPDHRHLAGPTTGPFVMNIRGGGTYHASIRSADFSRAGLLRIWLDCPPSFGPNWAERRLPPLRWQSHS